MNTTPIQLTEEQQQAIDLIKDWLANSPNQKFKLGGYAGTGKTTIIRFLLESLDLRVLVCAFTGKACNVLQRKGINASTIHSNIYNAHQDKDGWHFELKSFLETNPKLIIVDEASMISTELYNDLKSFKIKILFVGDPGQLEPVGDNPNLMQTPDFILSKIHRQAESSPIITLASNVRNGVGACLTHRRIGQSDEVIIRDKKITPEQLLTFNQFICAKNKTRQDLNTAVRDYQRKPKLSIIPGDKIIVLRNNLSFAVFNGMILFIDEILSDNAESWKVKVHDEINQPKTLDLWKPPFQSVIKKDAHIPRKYVYADFAYAITCHKSQGSEWDRVCVFHEWVPPQVWDMKRWSYTAITRAAQHLTYLV